MSSVLVTGGSGLVGSAVVDELLESGDYDEVRIFDSSPPRPSASEWIQGDLLSSEDVEQAMTDVRMVVHAGGVPRPTGTGTEKIMSVNVLGTFNVYEAAAKLGVDHVVFISSTAVIGTDWSRDLVVPAYLPIDEAHPCLPMDPYGLSKLLAEQICDYFWRRSDLSTTILRPPWVVSEQDLRDLRASGGRAVAGAHHYAYVERRDLAGAVRLALKHRIPGVSRLFTGAPDSTQGDSLQEIYSRLGHDALPGLDRVPDQQSGLSSEEAYRMLGWTVRHEWRELDEPASNGAGLNGLE